MQSVKALRHLAVLLLVSACSTFSGGDKDHSALETEIEVTKARASELQVEVARLKSENARLANQVLELQRDREAELDEDAAGGTDGRVAQLRDTDTPTVIAPAAPQPQANAVVETANAPEIEQSDVPVEEAPRLVQPSFASTESVFENEAAGDEIETESVLFGVHLASYRNVPEARDGWNKLQRENPDELGLLEPRLETVALPEKGVFLRLIGGGFSSEDKAAALCANLQAKNLFCAVSGFTGQRLSLADMQQ
ncbi:MAG: SPOR domain-containing protein [Hyphococcus sp.]